MSTVPWQVVRRRGRAARLLGLRTRAWVRAVPGGWTWECPPARHPEVRDGEVLGEVVPSWAYRDAWAVALALAVRHEVLYHADGRRLGRDLGLEVSDAEDGGPPHPPDPDRAHHLEACS